MIFIVSFGTVSTGRLTPPFDCYRSGQQTPLKDIGLDNTYCLGCD